LATRFVFFRVIDVPASQLRCVRNRYPEPPRLLTRPGQAAEHQIEKIRSFANCNRWGPTYG